MWCKVLFSFAIGLYLRISWAQGNDQVFRTYEIPVEVTDSLKQDFLFLQSWKDLKINNIQYTSGKRLPELDNRSDTVRLLISDEEEITGVQISPLTVVVDPSESIPIDQSELSANPLIKTPSRFDSRVEISALSADYEEFILINQRSKDVLCVLEKSRLATIDNERYELNISTKLGSIYNLCESEPYLEQPSVCIGTAFLVNNSTLVTARHVLDYHELKNLVFIKKFQLTTSGGGVNRIIPTRNVLEGQKLVGEAELGNYDMALIKLKYPTSFFGTSLSERALQNKDRVYALGHPLGLPMKATLRASVQSSDRDYYYTTLDTFQGNSGSPVYAKDSNVVIGMLVGGGADFESNGDCEVSRLCFSTDCQTEKVLRFDLVLPRIQKFIDSK